MFSSVKKKEEVEKLFSMVRAPQTAMAESAKLRLAPLISSSLFLHGGALWSIPSPFLTITPSPFRPFPIANYTVIVIRFSTTSLLLLFPHSESTILYLWFSASVGPLESSPNSQCASHRPRISGAYEYSQFLLHPVTVLVSLLWCSSFVGEFRPFWLMSQLGFPQSGKIQGWVAICSPYHSL